MTEFRKDFTASGNGTTVVVGANIVTLPQRKVRTSELVRRAINSHEGPFIISDLAQRLHSEFGEDDSDPIRAIIRNEINKLRYAGVLEVVEAGKGSRSGVYRKKPPRRLGSTPER